MTLEEVTLPIEVEWGRQHALLFSASIADRMDELHALYGQPDCVAFPVLLTDGRFMLAADILLAAEPSGYLHGMWEAADKAILLPAVEVVPMADAEALLPQPDPLP